MRTARSASRIALFPLLALAASLAAPAAAQGKPGADAGAILRKADSVLIPANASFNFSLVVERKGGETKENRFLARKKGDLKYLFYTYRPSASMGICHLRIDATIWEYFPLADSSFATSYKAAFLNSGLSYADVMYNELSRYYDASLVSTRAMARGLGESGTGRGPERECVELELRARKGADGYARIAVYLDPATQLPVLREYYTLSGDMLKEIAYGGFETRGGLVTAFSLEIRTAIDPDETTRARFWNISAEKSMGEQYFSLNYLKTWQPEIKE